MDSELSDRFRDIDAANRRKQRREAVWLIVLSSLFVVVGIFVSVSGELWIGVPTSAFFSSCLIAGIAEYRSLQRAPNAFGPRRYLLAMTVAAYMMGTACVIFLGAALFSWESLDAFHSWRSPTLLIVTAAIGSVFFGGGAVLLTVHAARRRRRRR